MDIKEMQLLMEHQLVQSRRLKARVQELEASTRPPLAVVGMALRLAGDLTTPEALWDRLCGDDCLLSEIPDDRPGLRAVYDPRPGQPGRSYVKRAGFLRDVAGFDPGFFGVSQREAESMDPQHRLLLETSWEAMERAGIAVLRQSRLPVGVFVGIMSSEYSERFMRRDDKSALDPYFGTGGGHCFAAGRINHTMGFCGPALSIDTACSSSLVAFHLATQSLQRGECRYALVGGANLIFSPDLMVSLCQSRALAPDGRSKTFTAAADGYGRGEGVATVVLMRLDEAERERRPILAIVRGSAINHDGASSGLTVPCGPAQQDVIRAALANAGVSAADLGYIEAHGTGTALGDPIELGALDAVVGSGAPGRRTPLVIGSLKSRIGHLEAAAGIAAVIKVVMMLGRGELLPAAGEHDVLNPLIPWERLQFTVPRQVCAWPQTRRVAGVSAFGMSGTNAHVVLEAYEPVVADPPSAGRPELLTLAAKSVPGLHELAVRVADRLRQTSPSQLPSLSHTLRSGRVAFGHRLAFVGTTPSDLADQITAVLDRHDPPDPPGANVSAILRVGLDVALLSDGLTELARAFPDLGISAAEAATAPAVELTRLLRSLGVPVKLVHDSTLALAAQLEWNSRSLPLLDHAVEEMRDLLLEALRVLFEGSADLRLDALRAPSARLIGDLSTYPFNRRRCWIDETVTSGPRAEQAAQPDVAPASDQSRRDPHTVAAFVLGEITSLLRVEGDLDLRQSFLAVGGDSFTAMLLKKSIEQRYGVDMPIEDIELDVSLSALLQQICEPIVGTAERSTNTGIHL